MEACPCKPVPASLSLARVGCWQEGRHAGPDLITGNFGLHKTFPQKNPWEGQSMQGRGGENRKGGREGEANQGHGISLKPLAASEATDGKWSSSTHF